MRYMPIILLALTISACDTPETSPKAVDLATLAPLSAREQALIIGADGAVQQGNLTAAEKDYLNAVALSTGHVEAHLSLARLYEKQQQPVKEQAILERALAFQPQHPRANYLLGKLHLDAGRFDKALDAFEQGLKQRPDDLDLNTGKAIANDMLGQHSAAQLVYARTLANHPKANLTFLKTNYAMSYLLSGEPKKAVALLQPEVKKPGATSVTRHNLALAYGMLGRHAEAKKVLNGEIDEPTRTLAIARLKEYLGTKPGNDTTTKSPVAEKPAGTKPPVKKSAPGTTPDNPATAPESNAASLKATPQSAPKKPPIKPASPIEETPIMPVETKPIPVMPAPVPVKPLHEKPVSKPAAPEPDPNEMDPNLTE